MDPLESWLRSLCSQCGGRGFESLSLHWVVTSTLAGGHSGGHWMSGRRAEPTLWWWAAESCWCATIEGKRRRFGKDLAIAKRKLRTMLRPAKERAPTDWEQATVRELLDEFYGHYEQAKRDSPLTVKGLRPRLQLAGKLLGLVTVIELRKVHLERVVARMKSDGYEPSYIRDVVGSVQQAFRWALGADMLTIDPTAGFRKPGGRHRTRIATWDEYLSLLRASARHLRLFLVCLRHTGCRPSELRRATWEDIDWEQRLLVTWRHKTVDQQVVPTPRVIPLSATVARILAWIKTHATSEHVLVNARGRPWTKDALVLAFRRARTRAGIGPVRGEDLVVYSVRHTYASQAIGRVSDTELAELMGHTTTRTLRRYVHLDARRLREIQERATGRE